ncbi:MAG: hypothetical protein ABEJ82_09000 [Haloplanus sp.]
MNRRAFLGAGVALAAGLGGCVASDGGEGGETPTRVTDRSFRDVGACDAPETATVGFDAAASRVRIEGCVTGPNGCSVARLDSATLGDGALSVVVTTGTTAGTETACTQALVSRGYEATVTVDRGVPSSVRVVHDVPGGRETVANESS